MNVHQSQHERPAEQQTKTRKLFNVSLAVNYFIKQELWELEYKDLLLAEIPVGTGVPSFWANNFIIVGTIRYSILQLFCFKYTLLFRFKEIR